MPLGIVKPIFGHLGHVARILYPPANPMVDPRQLAAARILAGLSQEELAALSGVGLSTIKGLEGGGRDTRVSNILRLLDTLRAKGVEVTSGGDRYVGGVQVVRGSPSDWEIQPTSLVDDDGDPATGDANPRTGRARRRTRTG